MPFDWLASFRTAYSRRKTGSIGSAVPLEPRTLLSSIPIGPEFRVNTATTLSQVNSSVAMDADGDSVVVWESQGQDGSGTGIYAQRFNSAGGTIGPEFRVNTFTANPQRNPDVAIDAAGNFVIVWESVNQDTSGGGIYAQRFNTMGTPLGPEFRVNTFTNNWQSNPSVAMDADGNFVVTWESLYQDGDFTGVYAQRFNSVGTPVGPEFQVNTHTSDEQYDPDVAMDASGDFVITWQSEYQDGDFYGIYAQRYNAAGNPQGAEFLVNSTTAGSQIFPSIAINPIGDFVITWAAGGQGNPDGVDIFSRRFNADGTAVGTEFLVNNYTTGDQNHPSISMNPQGEFIIAWNSADQDGGNYGIYAQRYLPSGSPIDPEFRVNSHTSQSQSNSSIATDARGNFVVAWNSNGQDGDAEGVFAQRYHIFHPDNLGTWKAGRFYLDSNRSNSWNGPATDSQFSFGNAADKPLAGDWNGDGFSEIGIWRNGIFFLDANGNGTWDGPVTDRQFAFGISTDTPVVGDWNHDGRDDVGVWRAGKFFLDTNANNAWNPGVDGIYSFGAASDTPVIGDWNADGTDDLGVWRAGKFYLDTNANRIWNAGVDGVFTFGNPTDTPVIGDWNADGIDDLGVWRAGKFYRDTNGNRAWNSGIDSVTTYGSATDIPVIGFWRPKAPPVPSLFPVSQANSASPMTSPTIDEALLASLIAPTKTKPT